MKKNVIITILSLIISAAAIAQQPKLKTVFSDNTYQLTGVAVSAKGRMFVNYPLWSKIYKYAVVEVMPNGAVKPYPNLAMNSWTNGKDGKNAWVCVQAVYVDDNDFLWVVDPAAPKLGVVYQNADKVVKIDLNTNKVIRTYFFTGTMDNNSYLNDIRVDTKKQEAYLTNSHEGGIVILDLKTGKSRQVLQSDKSVLSDPSYKFVVDGHEITKQGQPVKFNSDGIALTPAGDWLYYKPLSDNNLYRIKTADLLNTAITDQQLKGRVQFLGKFTCTDGMIFDKHGNLYLGDPQNYRMMKITPDLKMHECIKDPRLIWPDSYSISNGYLYISASQIQKQPDYNNGINKRTTPYQVFNVKLN